MKTLLLSVEEMILNFYRMDQSLVLKRSCVSTQEIVDTLRENGLAGTDRQNQMIVAQAMKNLGCERKKNRNSDGMLVWGYFGIENK